MKELELRELTQYLDSLFKDLINGRITEDEFNELSHDLYKKQTRLRYTIELENGLHLRKSSK